MLPRMNKKSIAKIGILMILLVVSIFLITNIHAETPAEEKARLEVELKLKWWIRA